VTSADTSTGASGAKLAPILCKQMSALTSVFYPTNVGRVLSVPNLSEMRPGIGTFVTNTRRLMLKPTDAGQSPSMK